MIETPGHEDGPVSYVYEPVRVWFCGDALAVAKDRVSFTSRYLTRDVAAARQAIRRCLQEDVIAICPGHRSPLLAVTEQIRERALERVDATKTWPIHGC